LNGVLKSTTGVRDVPEELERIKQVRFATRVGTDDEHSLAKGNVDLLKVPPVLEQ